MMYHYKVHIRDEYILKQMLTNIEFHILKRMNYLCQKINANVKKSLSTYLSCFDLHIGSQSSNRSANRSIFKL